MTSERLEELRRIAEAGPAGEWDTIVLEHSTVLALLDEIERLRRERDAALDVKGGDRGWPTRESARTRLVAEVGECCRGADPLCAAGCLVEAALRQRLVDKEGTA